jgi:hypothetical protein
MMRIHNTVEKTTFFLLLEIGSNNLIPAVSNINEAATCQIGKEWQRERRGR